MRIGILSTAPRSYSTRRLREAIRQRGCRARVINPLELAIHIEQAKPELFLRGKPIGGYAGFIPRIAASISVFGVAAVRQLQALGYYCLNGAEAIAQARDKLFALQVLSQAGVPTPPSAFVLNKDELLPTIQRLGGAPVIIKLLQGTQGIGVMLAESESSAQAIVEAMHVAKEYVLIQKFVAESRGEDIRAFVVGNKVIAAMRRSAQADDFRSNLHRGGSAKGIRLSKQYAQTAVQAAKVIGLDVAGVDILESNDGPRVMEVNSSPGLEGIEEACGVDVASAIIDHLIQQVTDYKQSS